MGPMRVDITKIIFKFLSHSTNSLLFGKTRYECTIDFTDSEIIIKYEKSNIFILNKTQYEKIVIPLESISKIFVKPSFWGNMLFFFYSIKNDSYLVRIWLPEQENIYYELVNAFENAALEINEPLINFQQVSKQKEMGINLFSKLFAGLFILCFLSSLFHNTNLIVALSLCTILILLYVFSDYFV